MYWSTLHEDDFEALLYCMKIFLNPFLMLYIVQIEYVQTVRTYHLLSISFMFCFTRFSYLCYTNLFSSPGLLSYFAIKFEAVQNFDHHQIMLETSAKLVKILLVRPNICAEKKMAVKELRKRPKTRPCHIFVTNN